MFMEFWRKKRIAASILTGLRLWLGYQWITAGLNKISEGFEADEFLNQALILSSGENPTVAGWWSIFLESVALPNVVFLNVLIPYGEFLVGLGLMLGALTRSAAFFGLVMNMSFLLSGSVGMNPTMLIVSLLILVSGYNAGKTGVDGLFLKTLIETKMRKRLLNLKLTSSS